TIRFSGRARPKAQAEKTAALETWIAERGYEITGPAVTAFYNAPFVPGPFRRNEIMIPVRLPD
ncbi:MAG: heme-binding protein, partial [Pseudomonadota bacterium]